MSSQIRKRVNKKITKAIHDFNLIEDGDRVLIATSGGKDSSVLLMELAARLGKFGPKCELAAIHIQSDFADKAPREFLQRMAEEYPQVPFYFKDVAVEARLKEGRKLNCYWCSTQRRTELIKFASENNFNKIALGHHMDDIVETLLMNMLYKGVCRRRGHPQVHLHLRILESKPPQDHPRRNQELNERKLHTQGKFIRKHAKYQDGLFIVRPLYCKISQRPFFRAPMRAMYDFSRKAFKVLLIVGSE